MDCTFPVSANSNSISPSWSRWCATPGSTSAQWLPTRFPPRRALGFNGSPSIFAPHAREVALGLDYWIAPAIVWQTEVDFELPHAGGTLYSFNGASTPTASSVGATPNDRAILTQFAVGF